MWCNHHHLCQNIWMPWSRIPYLKAFPFSWCHKNHYMIYCLQWKSQKGHKYSENTYAHYIYRSFDFWWLKGPPSRELYHTLMANIRVLIKCRHQAKKPATWRLEPSTFWGNIVREWKPEIAYSTQLLSRLLQHPSCLLEKLMRTLKHDDYCSNCTILHKIISHSDLQAQNLYHL